MRARVRGAEPGWQTLPSHSWKTVCVLNTDLPSGSPSLRERSCQIPSVELPVDGSSLESLGCRDTPGPLQAAPSSMFTVNKYPGKPEDTSEARGTRQALQPTTHKRCYPAAMAAGLAPYSQLGWPHESGGQRASCEKQGQGCLLSWVQTCGSVVPRSSSRNFPRRPLHPSSHPLHPVCLDGRCWLTHPLGGWKPALGYRLPVVPVWPSQAPLPGPVSRPIRSSAQSPLTPGRGWTPGTHGQVRPRMKAASLLRALLVGKPTTQRQDIGRTTAVPSHQIPFPIFPRKTSSPVLAGLSFHSPGLLCGVLVLVLLRMSEGVHTAGREGVWACGVPPGGFAQVGSPLWAFTKSLSSACLDVCRVHPFLPPYQVTATILSESLVKTAYDWGQRHLRLRPSPNCSGPRQRECPYPMGWGDMGRGGMGEETAAWLLPPLGVQGVPGFPDGRLNTPALSRLVGGGSCQDLALTTNTLAARLAGGRGCDVQWPHAAERKSGVMMPLTEAGALAPGGGPAGTELRWLWPKDQGVGVVEAVTVGKGFSRASLSFKGKEGFGKGLQWGQKGSRWWLEASSCFPSSYTPPTFPSLPTPTFVPSVAPMAQVSVLSSQDPEAQADDLAIPTLLKARVSRRPGETSAVLKDRKRGCFSHGEQHTHTKAGQWGLFGCHGYGERGGGQGHSVPRATLSLPGINCGPGLDCQTGAKSRSKASQDGMPKPRRTRALSTKKQDPSIGNQSSGPLAPPVGRKPHQWGWGLHRPAKERRQTCRPGSTQTLPQEHPMTLRHGNAGKHLSVLLLMELPGAPARSSLKFLPGQIPNPSVHNGRLLPRRPRPRPPPRGRGTPLKPPEPRAAGGPAAMPAMPAMSPPPRPPPLPY
ncbi:hypothetical protein Cadr_000021803 [Camelus dromedarius]|uniref:Uncharacterized protein n=1 Tax=Camelus dromedarius TaxID=9838 RepID=A0A5N4CT72_CAMDR|nr:hypothetical protein Cadr_000021803 [Camelus dromedarius]